MIVLCCYRSKCIVLLVSSVAVVKCDSVYKCDLRAHMLSGYHATFVDVIRSEENDEVIVGSASFGTLFGARNYDRNANLRRN